jgi:hypothetical protein
MIGSMRLRLTTGNQFTGTIVEVDVGTVTAEELEWGLPTASEELAAVTAPV